VNGVDLPVLVAMAVVNPTEEAGGASGSLSAGLRYHLYEIKHRTKLNFIVYMKEGIHHAPEMTACEQLLHN
jgi:hypothetical protein